MRVKLVNAIPVRNKDNPNRVIVRRADEIVDLPDEIGKRAVSMGAAKPVDDDGNVIEDEPEEGEDVELPERPSNGATKDTWRAYLGQLGAVTSELGPLEVPESASRDEMIALGDKRVADWNEV